MRVLLVDDDSAARRNIGELVQRARRDAEVVTCTHPKASLTLVRPFDVVAASAWTESSLSLLF